MTASQIIKQTDRQTDRWRDRQTHVIINETKPLQSGRENKKVDDSMKKIRT